MAVLKWNTFWTLLTGLCLCAGASADEVMSRIAPEDQADYTVPSQQLQAALEAVGTLKVMHGEVWINGVSAKQGDQIRLGDIVTTSDIGSAEFEFNDMTSLVVGPRSALEMEDYLIRQTDEDVTSAVTRTAVNALSGTFRFGSGEKLKKQMKQRKTDPRPSKTIGVRG